MGESGGLMRGASLDQDVRFSNKELKLINSLKFPPEYSVKVDMKKVQLDVLKPWISQQITKILGFEDEVLIAYVFGLLEEKQFPDPRHLQVNITGFLEHDASDFCKELWKHLNSAQNSIAGIPPQFLAKKKIDILNRKAEHDRIRGELAKRRGEDGGSAPDENGGGEEQEETLEQEQKRAEKAIKTIDAINQKYKTKTSEEDSHDSRRKSSGDARRSDSTERRPSGERRRSDSRDRKRSGSGEKKRDRSRERRRSNSRERRDKKRRSLSRDRSRRDRDDRRDRNDHRKRSRDDRDDRSRDDRSRDDRRKDDKKNTSSDDGKSPKKERPNEGPESSLQEDENEVIREQELREKALASLSKSRDD